MTTINKNEYYNKIYSQCRTWSTGLVNYSDRDYSYNLKQKGEKLPIVDDTIH